MNNQPLVSLGQGSYTRESRSGWPRSENPISIVTLCACVIARAWRRVRAATQETTNE